MFDDRLFDTIMSEMMLTFGSDVNTGEGSLVYNACCKIALKLEEVYGDMDQLNDNLLPDKMDLTHLISFGKERGVIYREATAPVIIGRFNQDIEIGEQFTAGEHSYVVKKLVENHDYELECLTTGSIANNNSGSLDPVDYIDNYAGGTIVKLVTAGVDDEETEAYRDRIMESFEIKAFSGNKADYIKLINHIDGVGAVKPMRASAGSSEVVIYILDETMNTPTTDEIARIQNIVDPVGTAGEGDGLAPICHKVTIKGAKKSTIEVSPDLTYESGYSWNELEGVITETTKKYIDEIKNSWENNGKSPCIIKRVKLEAKISSLEGVGRCESLGIFVNGVVNNKDYVEIPFDTIPELLEVREA